MLINFFGHGTTLFKIMIVVKEDSEILMKDWLVK